MAEGFYQLTYRDLADRLGISPDAARMKANRKAKAGLWRFLPDEGPGQERRIEIPAADLDNLPKRVRPDEQAAPAAEAPNAAAPADTVAPAVVAERAPNVVPIVPAERAQPAPEQAIAPERVEQPEPNSAPTPVPEQDNLPEQSVEAVSAPERSPAAERVGEQSEPGSEGEQPATPEQEGGGDELVSTLSARVANLTDRLVGEIEGREKDREALAAAETREDVLKTEIERLCARVSELTEALEQPRRSFWKRIVQGKSGTED